MDAAEMAAAIGMLAEYMDAEAAEVDYEGITEEAIAVVMSWFEIEIKLAAGANTVLPPPSPPPPTTTTYYVTVNWATTESCGPSLSWPASTVMASVDERAAGALLRGSHQALAEPSWPVPDQPAAVGEEEEEEEEDVDEWVLQLLTDGPPPVEEQHGGQ